jgi:hypothetical protein
MSKIDWSKAGTRLRRTIQDTRDGGTNPDWNHIDKRWKRIEEYAGESLTADQVFARAPCAHCRAAIAAPCVDANQRVMDGAHNERRIAAGNAMVAEGWSLDNLQRLAHE